MKIENNGISALTPKPAIPARRLEKTTSQPLVSVPNHSPDKADLSQESRLLARSRAALEAVPESETDQVQKLRSQVQNGDYTIQVSAIARRLAAGIFNKS